MVVEALAISGTIDLRLPYFAYRFEVYMNMKC